MSCADRERETGSADAPLERHVVGLEPQVVGAQARRRIIVEDEVEEVLANLSEDERQVGDARRLQLRACERGVSAAPGRGEDEVGRT